MNTIDIIGAFSNADIAEKNKIPVLYKIIESAITHNFTISKICLYNIFENENKFITSYQIILDQLKENYKSYDFNNINIKNIHHINAIVNLENIDKGIILYQNETKNNQIQISDYFNFFNKVTITSKSKYIYFNLQSGNIQSKEALQICCEYFSRKKNYIYFESIKNENSVHKVNPECVSLCHNLEDIEEIAKTEGYDKLISRISIKKDIYQTIELFHNSIISNLINNNKFFEMYYHYVNYKNIFCDNCYKVLDSCFNNKITISYHLCNENNSFNETEVYRIEKKEIAKYFLYRLFFINFKITENNYDRTLYKNIEELIFLLYHLESCDYVEAKDKYYLISSKKLYKEVTYIDCLKKYFGKENLIINNGVHLQQIILDKINPKLIEDFNKLFKKERHDFIISDNIDEKNTLLLLMNDLILKFNEEYIKYFNNENYDSFSKCYKLLINSFKENIKVDNQKIKKVLSKKITNNVCFLSMCGSTDPINSRNNKDFYLSSFLTFKYGIEYIDENYNKDANNSVLMQLHNINKIKNVPSYFLMTKESITDLFDKNNNEECLKLNEINDLYKGEINIVPFAKDSDNNPLNYEEIISTNFNLQSLLNLQSYSKDGYSFERCSLFIKKVVSILLQKYDNIVLVESSGLPNIKMALSFMTLMYPSRIIPFMVKNPNYRDCNITSEIVKNENIRNDKREIVEPLESKSCILSDISKSNEDYNNLISYLLQNIEYDDNLSFFKSNNLKDNINTIKKHDEVDLDEFETIKMARTMCKSIYLSKFGFYEDSLECLDKVFEIVLGKRLQEYIKMNNICLNQLKLNKFKDINEIYNTNMSIILKNNKRNKLSNNRLNGVINAITYASNVKGNLLESTKWINDTWAAISDLKHSGSSKRIFIDKNSLDKLAAFDKEIMIKFNEEYDFYENILKNFPQLGYLKK